MDSVNTQINSAELSDDSYVTGGSVDLSNHELWSHPMNKDVPQEHKYFFNTVKAYLDALPTNENGKQVIDGHKFVNLLYTLGAKPII